MRSVKLPEIDEKEIDAAGDPETVTSAIFVMLMMS
jgi:hypothetical protein